MTGPTAKPYINDIALYKPGKSKAGAYKLSSNENPLGCSPLAREAILQSLHANQTYPDGAATALRSAIAEAEGIDPARIICGAGSDEVIGMVCAAYLGEGDTIVQSAHGFLMYSIYAAQNGATTIFAPEIDYTTHIDSLLAAVVSTTKIVFLANPNNPTGTYLPRNEVSRLRASLPDHVLLVLDGAYAEYVEDPAYDDGKSLADLHENVIITRTFSKIHGLAALRVGWGYACLDIVNTLHKVRSPFNVSSAAQVAAAAAIKDRDFVAKSVAHNRLELVRLSTALDEMSLVYTPSVGNFILVHGPTDEPAYASKLSAYLADNDIIVREVSGYGLPNALRMSIGTTQANTALIGAIKAFMKATA